MPVVVVDVASLPAALRAWAVKHRLAAERVMFGVAHLVRADAIRNIRTGSPRPAVDTGKMSGIDYRAEAIPGGAQLENVAPYAAHIEYGTRPGTWTPIGPLLAWAARKTRGLKLAGRTREQAVRALAYGARWSIHAHGLRARSFHERAVLKAPGLIRRELARAFARGAV